MKFYTIARYHMFFQLSRSPRNSFPTRCVFPLPQQELESFLDERNFAKNPLKFSQHINHFCAVLWVLSSDSELQPAYQSFLCGSFFGLELKENTQSPKKELKEPHKNDWYAGWTFPSERNKSASRGSGGLVPKAYFPAFPPTHATADLGAPKSGSRREERPPSSLQIEWVMDKRERTVWCS